MEQEQEQKTEGGGQRTAAAFKTCPFCGHEVAHHDDDLDGREAGKKWYVVECANAACHAAPMVIAETLEEATARWNTRSDGRTEFGEIIERLKQRGLITEEDAVQARAGLEVAHA